MTERAGPKQFALTGDQRAIRDLARKFTADRITPSAAEWDERRHYSLDAWKAAGAPGFGAEYRMDHPLSVHMTGHVLDQIFSPPPATDEWTPA